jgi:ribosome-associated protein
MRDVEITREPVELYKILKFEGLVENGGQAKAVIEQGLVTVNGEVETRKRKQIVAGDVIGFATQTLRIVRASGDSGESAATEAKAPATKRRVRLDVRPISKN